MKKIYLIIIWLITIVVIIAALSCHFGMITLGGLKEGESDFSDESVNSVIVDIDYGSVDIW